MQQNRIKNWVHDIFSKILVILAFFDKNQHMFSDKVHFDKIMLQNQYLCMWESVFYKKSKTILLFMG